VSDDSESHLCCALWGRREWPWASDR
jgi:hypothetical protein